jgi:RND family efflux transporter MFP subunit
MKQFAKYGLNSFLISILLISSFVIQSCGSKKDDTAKTDKLNYVDTVSVEAQTVTKQELSLTKTFSGTLEGENQANIFTKIPERIMKINVTVGQYVKAGAVVFELDKGGASSQFYQAQAAFYNAEKNYQRMKNLLKEGAVSQQAYDGIETLYEVAKANFDAARSTVEITSPLSGTVTAINVTLGDLANPQVPMATVANYGRMKAKFNVGESDMHNFFAGQSVGVYSELNPQLTQTGKVSQISKSADIQSRTFEIQAIFSNTKDSWFKPGMFCRVNVNLKTKNDALAIPMSAIIKKNNIDGVYIINDNKSTFNPVTIGIMDGKSVEIVSGLKEGNNIVTLGMNNLKDGSVVVISKN